MAPQLDAAPGVREIRLSPEARARAHIAPVIVLVAGVVIIPLSFAVADTASAALCGASGGLFCIALSALAIASIRTSRIVIDGDVLTFFDVGMRPRTVRRGDICGRRFESYDGPEVVLELRSGRGTFRLSTRWAKLAEVDAWLEGLPDLDAEDRARIEARIAAEPALGVTGADRTRALASGRWVTLILSGVAMFGAVWGMIPRAPDGVLVTLAVIPLVVVAFGLGQRGLYTLHPRRNDPRSALFVPLFLPPPVLAIRGFMDVDVIDYTLPILGALVLGPFVGVAAARFEVEPTRLRSTRVWMIALVTVHLVGVALFANRTLDRAAPETFRVEVVGREIVRGDMDMPYLDLAPWGPFDHVTESHATFPLYRRTGVGDTVCVDLHRGALGAPWYEVHACAAP